MDIYQNQDVAHSFNTSRFLDSLQTNPDFEFYLSLDSGIATIVNHDPQI